MPCFALWQRVLRVLRAVPEHPPRDRGSDVHGSECSMHHNLGDAGFGFHRHTECGGGSRVHSTVSGRDDGAVGHPTECHLTGQPCGGK